MVEKFIEHLQGAEKTLRAVDHMTYVTFPLIKDKKLLIKIVSEIKKAIAYCINAILQFEYINNKIKMENDAKANFKTFVNISSKRFGINKEEIKKILEIFELVEIHKQSPIEFAKEDKVVILSENMNHTTLTHEKNKDFIILAKNLLKKTKSNIIAK